MPLSFNEIRNRALAFSQDWKGASNERAEAQTFWNEFFAVFGITRRRVASFERPVKKHDGSGGFIDLLWKGLLMVEHKSLGKDLERAYGQALDYFPGLKERDLPRYVVVSDFARFKLYDLDRGEDVEFALSDLHENVQQLAFIAGYKSETYGEQNPVNVKAAERLGKLHDSLLETGYTGHKLEVLLVRVLFCLFAEDTGIFERRRLLQDYIENRTAEDGSDLGLHLEQLFEVLNTPNSKRQSSLDESAAEFPYVNGKLFKERLPVSAFNSDMRETLLDCCGLDWSEISPAIFGSLFQSIMDAEARRHFGAHYTEEKNILKALDPLFLSGLREEFEHLRALKRGKEVRLQEFHKKLASIRIMDPACGCGNFLVVAYRELRLLELDVLKELYGSQMDLRGAGVVLVDVDQFIGIEISEFPAQIAQVALWLTDHQMNLKVSEEFGQYFARLPLKTAPVIKQGNAVQLNWDQIAGGEQVHYIVGNPPFAGKKRQTPDQKADLESVAGDIRGSGILDYVSCWYFKADEYLDKHPKTEVAFVSTNSISQGEQVAILWSPLVENGLKINFAHRTFQWTSGAPGKAAVHCVVIGFARQNQQDKILFEYEDVLADPHALSVSEINPYLVEARTDVLVTRSREAPPGAPPIVTGSMPNEGGNLLLTGEEKEELLAREPEAKPWLKRVVGSTEFIHGTPRWCLWLEGISPTQLRSLSAVKERVDRVRQYREASRRAATRSLAETPYLFGEIRQPSTPEYLIVPRHSSIRRKYIPIGFVSQEIVATDAVLIVPDADVFSFGILSSAMHVAWVRHVAGMIKSDFRYSAQIVYNNYPWPSVSESRKKKIRERATEVLEQRAKHADSSLADLYDPLTMPRDLHRAHRALDREVDRSYRSKAFRSDADRMALLLDLYAQTAQ